MLTAAEREKRQSIIDACRSMNTLDINQGTSGNISLRDGEGMLITPTSMAYDLMRPEDIVKMRFDGAVEGEGLPSTEWRFHLDILRERSDVNAVVHAHPIYCTTLAILGRGVPPL
ncbi:MAG TPA: class II aldolase/adducin family protein, partial [Roseiarcus sp.]|nr:class II aldolase/adducin family protein [Roseiarcus sp.]